MFSNKKIMEEYSTIQEHIKQIIKVQLLIGKHNLKQQRARDNIPSYAPSGMYFKLRNCAESLRIQKLKFIQHKNNLQSKVGGN
tara:strand:- start:2089 stop:2337 length:249 start_codon:yes stop_codon:yes gene_type:complete